MFINVLTDQDAESAASKEVADRGWATLEIERYKDITDQAQFEGKATPGAEAFRDAVASGFGISISPQMAST